MKQHQRATGIVALLLTLVLAACGGGAGASSGAKSGDGTATQAAANHDKAFVGLWEVRTMETDGELTDADQVKAMRDAGYYTIYLEVGEDGSLTLDTWGSTIGKGTWQSTDSSNATFKITDFQENGTRKDAAPWEDPMTLKDGVLTFGSNDFIMTFQPMEKDNRSELKKVEIQAS